MSNRILTPRLLTKATRNLIPRLQPTTTTTNKIANARAAQTLRFFSNTPTKMDPNEAKGQTEQGKDDWKHRAPYRLREPNENFKSRYEASCHCGKVKYQLSREEPLDSKLCHCTTCQTQHGKHCPPPPHP